MLTVLLVAALAAIVIVLVVVAARRPRAAPVPVRTATPVVRTARVEALLAGLADPAIEAWLAGGRAMGRAARRGELTEEEVIQLLLAIVDLEPFDERHDPQIEIAFSLVHVEPRAAYVPVLDAVIPRLRDRARVAAYALLVRLPAGVDVLVDHMRRAPAHAVRGLAALRSSKIATTAGQRAAILARARESVLVDQIAMTALDWRMRLVLDAAELARTGVDFVRGYRAARARLDAIGAANAEDPDDVAMIVGVYLDLFHHLPLASVVGELDAASRDPDAGVAVFAVATILRGGRAPAAAALEAVCRNDHARWVLHQVLGSAGMVELIPPRWRTQEALARADLDHWLAFPSELGKSPDELELMKVVPIDADDGDALEVYVFKFRTKPPHWAADKGWMAGVSGPYRRGDPPRLGGGNTFSRFEPADAGTPEAHAARVAEVLDRWRAAGRDS